MGMSILHQLVLLSIAYKLFYSTTALHQFHKHVRSPEGYLNVIPTYPQEIGFSNISAHICIEVRKTNTCYLRFV